MRRRRYWHSSGKQHSKPSTTTQPDQQPAHCARVSATEWTCPVHIGQLRGSTNMERMPTVMCPPRPWRNTVFASSPAAPISTCWHVDRPFRARVRVLGCVDESTRNGGTEAEDIAGVLSGARCSSQSARAIEGLEQHCVPCASSFRCY